MRRALIPAMAAAAVLVLPSQAAAVIVPQQGMAGVRLGMTEAHVRSVLGRPTSATSPSAEITGRVRLLRYGSLSVLLIPSRGGRVFSISTTGRTQRTVRGVGVGSSEAAVRTLVRGARCRIEFGYRHCFVGAQLAGRIVTDFSIGRSGRVLRVTVGRVID